MVRGTLRAISLLVPQVRVAADAIGGIARVDIVLIRESRMSFGTLPMLPASAGGARTRPVSDRHATMNLPGYPVLRPNPVRIASTIRGSRAWL